MMRDEIEFSPGALQLQEPRSLISSSQTALRAPVQVKEGKSGEKRKKEATLAQLAKTKVKPLRSLVRRRLEIILLLLNGHGVLDLVASLVAPHIVALGKQVDDDVHAGDGHQLAVAASVLGTVVTAVDVGVAAASAHLHRMR